MDLSADALNSSEAQPESASSEDPAAAPAPANAMPLCDLAFRPWCGSNALWFVSLKREAGLQSG